MKTFPENYPPKKQEGFISQLQKNSFYIHFCRVICHRHVSGEVLFRKLDTFLLPPKPPRADNVHF